MIWFLIVLSLFLFVFFSGIYFTEGKGDYMEGWGFVTILFFVIFVIFCLSMPLGKIIDKKVIRSIESVRLTIQKARMNKRISDQELATLQIKIVEYNVKISELKYSRKSKWFNWFTSSDVDKLKYLE